jgi:hypothetical protein
MFTELDTDLGLFYDLLRLIVLSFCRLWPIRLHVLIRDCLCLAIWETDYRQELVNHVRPRKLKKDIT